LNILTLYSLSNLSSLYLRLKKRTMKRFLMRSFAYWYVMLPVALHGFCTSVHTSTGATPPPSLSIQHKGSASHGGQSPVNRSSNESEA